MAQRNYWGHPEGPTHPSNPDGAGDIVSNDVDFALWRGPVLLKNSVTYAVSNTATDDSGLSYDSGTYTRYYPDGRSVHFDTQGWHVITLYPNGRQHTYTYNPDGSTATFEITAPGQAVPNAIWTFNYTNSKLAGIIDPVGRVIDFVVDGNNQLTQVSIPGMGDRRFYYNEQNLLTQQVDEAGAVTSYGYDGYGRITTHTDPLRAVYDPQTGTTTMTGEVRQFVGSDTGYALINDSAVGDPDNPATAVPTSADLVNSVT